LINPRPIPLSRTNRPACTIRHRNLADYQVNKVCVPLMFMSGFQTPAAIRQLGCRSAAVAEAARVRGAGQLAHAAVEAASRQTRSGARPGSRRFSYRVTRQTVLDLDRQIAGLDRELAGIFRTNDDAAIITSRTGIGDVLGAEFLALVRWRAGRVCIC
jgi:hypothetical protein